MSSISSSSSSCSGSLFVAAPVCCFSCESSKLMGTALKSVLTGLCPSAYEPKKAGRISLIQRLVSDITISFCCIFDQQRDVTRGHMETHVTHHCNDDKPVMCDPRGPAPILSYPTTALHCA